MIPFTGFLEGRSRPTSIPAEFFNDLLPEIDSYGELRVTLYILWYLDRQESTYHQFRLEEIASDPEFLKGFSNGEIDPAAQLENAIQRSVKRGTFLREVTPEGETVFFLNSPRGQAGFRAMQAGQLGLLPANQPSHLGKDKPNIFRLYEENIGPLTPLIAEDLRAAELEYPDAWIEKAFHLAVQRNARSWRYIDTVLRRWKEEGKDGTNQRGDRQDRQGYTEWENG